jgi:hypothetical protein
MNVRRMAGMRDPTGTGVRGVLASYLTNVLGCLMDSMRDPTGTGVHCVLASNLSVMIEQLMVGMRALDWHRSALCLSVF